MSTSIVIWKQSGCSNRSGDKIAAVNANCRHRGMADALTQSYRNIMPFPLPRLSLSLSLYSRIPLALVLLKKKKTVFPAFVTTHCSIVYPKSETEKCFRLEKEII